MTKTDYHLELTQPYDAVASDPELSAFERRLVRALFGGSQSRWVSSLKNHFYTHLPALRDELYNSTVKRGYFTHRPDRIRSGYLVAGLAVAAVGLFATLLLHPLMGYSTPPVGPMVSVVLCGIFLAMAARTMPRKTRTGKDALVRARGFEEYLSRTERQEIEYQERQGYFEKFLPYAMAFGIADKWAQAFEGLQTEPPKWYAGYDGAAFRPSLFAHDMNAATSNWGSAMASQPRSSGGGGSGFSGGFSGGGGGGGGGGAW